MGKLIPRGRGVQSAVPRPPTEGRGWRRPGLRNLKNLKNKQSNKITTLLPSINECNYIQTKLLIFAEAILICGFVSGLSLQYFSTGTILIIDHKTIFTILAMVVIAIILFLQERSGVRGKIAVRFIMLAYLLLTLAYPGVKFVAQIVI